MSLRKNASLSNVAIAARRKADRAKCDWQNFTDAMRACSFGDPERRARDWQARQAWERYRDLDEIASHLERLAAH